MGLGNKDALSGNIVIKWIQCDHTVKLELRSMAIKKIHKVFFVYLEITRYIEHSISVISKCIYILLFEPLMASYNIDGPWNLFSGTNSEMNA